MTTLTTVSSTVEGCQGRLHVSYPVDGCVLRAGVHVTGTEFVDRGAAIQLVCNATGRPDPPHNVDWYKVRQPAVKRKPRIALQTRAGVRWPVCDNYNSET